MVHYFHKCFSMDTIILLSRVFFQELRFDVRLLQRVPCA